MANSRYSVNIDRIAWAIASAVGMSPSGLHAKIVRFLDSRGERNNLTATEKELISKEVEAQKVKIDGDFERVRKLLS